MRRTNPDSLIGVAFVSEFSARMAIASKRFCDICNDCQTAMRCAM